MHVAFDHQVFVRQRVGGVSRYVCALAGELAGLPEARVSVVAPWHLNDHLTALHGVAVYGRQVPAHPRVLARLAPLLAARAATRLRGLKPDLVHETYYAARSVAPPGTPRVLTVHDMIHERFAHLYPPGDRTAADKRAAAARAAHVICISHATQADVCERLGVPVSRTSVVHHGVSLAADAGAHLPPPVAGPYALYVGQRGAQKNFAVLVAAWAGSGVLRAGLRLVCFGGGPFTPAERARLTAAGLDSGAVMQCTGDDAALAAAYRHARALVMPSRYEGFGLPVVEAMVLGCPVLAGDCAPLREVGGDAAVYAHVDRPEEWASAVAALAGDETGRAARVTAGRAHAAQFSWARCARATRAVYAQLDVAAAA